MTTPNVSEQVKSLENDIQGLEQEIEQKELKLRLERVLLKKIKSYKPAVPFAAAKLGRTYYLLLAKVTKPAADVHDDCCKAIANPMKYEGEKVLAKAQSLLASLAKVTTENEKQATAAAKRAAVARIGLEPFSEVESLEGAVKRVRGELFIEMTRLRPAPSAEAQNLLNNLQPAAA